jgi:hypothetical protein
LRRVGVCPGFADSTVFGSRYTVFDTIPFFRTVKAKGPANAGLSVRSAGALAWQDNKRPSLLSDVFRNVERGMTDMYATPCHRPAVQ